MKRVSWAVSVGSKRNLMWCRLGRQPTTFSGSKTSCEYLWNVPGSNQLAHPPDLWFSRAFWLVSQVSLKCRHATFASGWRFFPSSTCCQGLNFEHVMSSTDLNQGNKFIPLQVLQVPIYRAYPYIYRYTRLGLCVLLLLPIYEVSNEKCLPFEWSIGTSSSPRDDQGSLLLQTE